MSSIVLGPPASLTFISENDHVSIIHKPIENTVEIATNANCQKVTFSDGFGYGFESFLVYFYVLEKKI